MLRVVADANVLISAALARSPQAPSVLTLDAAIDGRVELITGDLDLFAIDPDALAIEVLTPRQLVDRLNCPATTSFASFLPSRSCCFPGLLRNYPLRVGPLRWRAAPSGDVLAACWRRRFTLQRAGPGPGHWEAGFVKRVPGCSW